MIARVPSGWVLMGHSQLLPGYCLLVADPVVADLHLLQREPRLQFLEDMALLGEALMRVTGAARINYEILGNSAPALHAHVIPRHDSEPAALREAPVWRYDDDARAAVPFDAAEHGPLMQRIARELLALGADVAEHC